MSVCVLEGRLSVSVGVGGRVGVCALEGVCVSVLGVSDWVC